MGSRENLKSPSSPTDIVASGGGGQHMLNEWSTSPQMSNSRKNSLPVPECAGLSSRRSSEHDPHEAAQSTTEMFKDLLAQKRNLLLSKLTSFESDVSFDL